MKNILLRITALTLVELIIATMLVTVVLFGLYSITSVLFFNNQDYAQRYSVKSETQATLNHILNDASLAVGSATTDSYGNLDLGILIGSGNPPGVGDSNSFCIHQSPATGDIWVCYTWHPSTDPTYPNQIVYCTFNYIPATANPSFRGAASCISSNNPVSGPTYLGTAFSNPVASFTTSGFSITIQNCLDNSADSCSNTGSSTDPVNNPEVQLSGSVYPAQEGV